MRPLLLQSFWGRGRRGNIPFFSFLVISLEAMDLSTGAIGRMKNVHDHLMWADGPARTKLAVPIHLKVSTPSQLPYCRFVFTCWSLNNFSLLHPMTDRRTTERTR